MKTNAEILEDIIKSRRSIFPKDYTAEAIPQDVLDKILESANYAPSHKKTNPWRFRIFQGLENRIGRDFGRAIQSNHFSGNFP